MFTLHSVIRVTTPRRESSFSLSSRKARELRRMTTFPFSPRFTFDGFLVAPMTSSDCLSSNNHHPQLPGVARFHLPVSTAAASNDGSRRSSPCPTTPTSTSPSNYYPPSAGSSMRFPQPNMIPYPRHPYSQPLRNSLQPKPPEQEVLDQSFLHAFNMKQKEEESVKKNADQSTAMGKFQRHTLQRFIFMSVALIDRHGNSEPASHRHLQPHRYAYRFASGRVAHGRRLRNVRSAPATPESTAILADEFERSRQDGEHAAVRHPDQRRITVHKSTSSSCCCCCEFLSISISREITITINNIPRDRTA